MKLTLHTFVAAAEKLHLIFATEFSQNLLTTQKSIESQECRQMLGKCTEKDQ